MILNNAKTISLVKNSQCLDRYIIEYCAPTLAGLKTGGMFRINFSSNYEMYTELGRVKKMLSTKSISITILKIIGTGALVYVYRQDMLRNDLKDISISTLLKKCGYSMDNIEKVLQYLKFRMNENSEFPHEIGAFLGYPPCDVIGFVVNKGANSIYSGWWKVYKNVEQAKKQFIKFDKCREVYKKLYLSGRTTLQLTVAA